MNNIEYNNFCKLRHEKLKYEREYNSLLIQLKRLKQRYNYEKRLNDLLIERSVCYGNRNSSIIR